ncbi:phage tail spike protein, partial [Paenibacillus alvei]
PDNFTIHLRKKIGADNGLQYRIRKNVVSTNFRDEVGSLVTRMYAQMKDGRTFIGLDASYLTDEERMLLSQIPGAIANGKLAVNYLISPYQAYWASESIPYFDGEIIEQDLEDPVRLLEATRKALREQEVPALEVAVSAADLFKLDKAEPRPGLGDTVRCIDPELGLDNVSARITELTEYPFALDKHAQVTVSNVMLRDYQDIIADLERSKRVVDNMFSGGRIRTEVFENFAKLAVHDIHASKTEIKYDERGIILVDKMDNRNQVALTSNGIVISTDGLQSARAAITARGIVAEQIVGQLGSFVSMLIGAGNDVVQINTNGIAAGHVNWSSAPFRLDMKGNLVANSLTANYAKIFASSFDNGEITGSSINVGNGQFTVDRNGNMYAGNGRFRGDIEASTITGSTIRTSVTGGRIELHTGGFSFYDNSGTQRVKLGWNSQVDISGHTYYNTYGDPMGIVYAITDEMHVIGNRNLRLGAGSGTIYLQGPVHFTSGSSVTGLNLTIAQITGLRDKLDSLQNQLDSLRYSYNGHTHSVNIGTHNHGNQANQNWGGTFTTSTP